MRTDFVNNLVTDLCFRFPTIDGDIARQIVFNHLKNYEITERYFTALVTPDFTTEALLRAFRAYKLSQNISLGTLEQYILTARQLCDYVGKPLTLITTDDVIFFLHNYKMENGCSSRTMENKRVNLNSVFSTLHKHNKINNNPMLLVDGIKFQPVHKEALNEAEIERIFMACEGNKRNMAIVRLLLDTGCRASELINIKIGDIDTIRRRITVTGKGNKQRVVIFGGATSIRLQAYLKERNEREGKLCCDDNDYLFVSLVKPFSKMTKSSLRLAIKKIGASANLPHLHCHLFRHTTATMLVRSGVPIEKVSKYLGHSNINTTMIYITQDINSTLSDVERVIA